MLNKAWRLEFHVLEKRAVAALCSAYILLKGINRKIVESQALVMHMSYFWNAKAGLESNMV